MGSGPSASAQQGMFLTKFDGYVKEQAGAGSELQGDIDCGTLPVHPTAGIGAITMIHFAVRIPSSNLGIAKRLAHALNGLEAIGFEIRRWRRRRCAAETAK